MPLGRIIYFRSIDVFYVYLPDLIRRYLLFVLIFQFIFFCTESFRSLCGKFWSAGPGGLLDKVGLPGAGGCELESR